MTELFDMQTRPELVLLQKTMVVVEGVARTLDPAFDMWTDVRAGGRATGSQRNLGPRRPARDAAEGVGALGRAGRQLPELAARAERLSREFDAHGASTASASIRETRRTAIGRAEARAHALGRASRCG